METTLPFLKPEIKVPEMRVGEIAVAKILSIDEVDGQKGPMLEYSLELEGGHKSKAWMSHSESPSVLSNEGKICTALSRATGKIYQTVDEAIKDLQRWGRVIVRCDGHRPYNGKIYPKLKIVTEELPKPHIPAMAQGSGKTQSSDSTQPAGN